MEMGINIAATGLPTRLSLDPLPRVLQGDNKGDCQGMGASKGSPHVSYTFDGEPV